MDLQSCAPADQYSDLPRILIIWNYNSLSILLQLLETQDSVSVSNKAATTVAEAPGCFVAQVCSGTHREAGLAQACPADPLVQLLPSAASMYH